MKKRLTIFVELDIQQYTLVAQKSGYVTNRKSVAVFSGKNEETKVTLEKIK